MTHYRVYGLTLASTLSLPGLTPGDGEVDIYIDLQRANTPISHEHSPILLVNVSPSRVHLTWSAVGDLLIEEGRRITVLPDPDADEDALRLFVLGAGLGVLLHQRGLLVLHASGVAIDQRVVGFIGGKGWGKSTMTAALHRRGHTMIADELLVISFDTQHQVQVIPGPPQMKLWADALFSTGGDFDSAVRVRAGINKFHVNTANAVIEEYPLNSLYLLGAGEQLSIQPLSSSEAFLAIMPHLYICRFGTAFLQATGAVHAFRQLHKLLRLVIVKRLLRPRDLSQLADVAQLIEKDVHQQLQPVLIKH